MSASRPTSKRVKLGKAIQFAVVITCLLWIAAAPSDAQDVCIDTVFDSPTHNQFYFTGSGNYRTLAGETLGGRPAHGSIIFRSGVAKIAWTLVAMNDELFTETRCDIDFATGTGDGIRIVVRAVDSVSALRGTCEVVACIGDQ